MFITKNPASCRVHVCARIVAALLLSALVGACNGDTMPETRPADFRLSYSNVAGMLARGGNLYISGGTALFRYRYDSERGKSTVRLPDSTLDALWAKLRREKFTDIRSDDRGQVYDRGGTTITVEWAGKRYTARNAGNMFISKRSRKSWREVRGAVGRLIVEHFRRLPNGAPMPKKAAPSR